MQDTVAVLRAQTGIREPTLGFVLSHSAESVIFTPTNDQLKALSL